MKNLLVNIFLFLAAIVLLIVVTPLGLVCTLIESIYREMEARKNQNRKKEGIWYAEASMLNNALSLDIFGNVINKDFLNFYLIRKLKQGENPHRPVDISILFGNPRMSISGVIGLNAERNTLSFLGRMLGKFLNLLDKNHIEKAADNNRKYITE